MDLEKFVKTLRRNRFTVKCFSTGVDAAEYLDCSLDGRTIGFGDSATIANMGLYEKLSAHNTVFDPAQSGKDNDLFLKIAEECLTAEIFLTSVNAMAETGEMVNIDGTGNRIAGSLFRHKKVYFIVSLQRVEPTLEKAIWRARNIAAPQNAKRLKLQTPCAIKGDRCYNCFSPDRICNALTIYYKKMNDIEDMEILLIEENLGL